MKQAVSDEAELTAVGRLLKEWRSAQRVSQIDLAFDANISTRHLSYIETGRSKPSREVIMRLADALDMPLRERNALLHSAGFAPVYRESGLDAAGLAGMRRAMEVILGHQEPYPAFVLDRHWNIIMANDATIRVNTCVMKGQGEMDGNLLRLFFTPGPFRDAVENWDEVAGDLLRHLHHEVARAPSDKQAKALLDECLSFPDVPRRWRLRDVSTGPSPLITTVLRHPDGGHFRFFSTITTFASPNDVTLEDLRIECCFPVDDDTIALCRVLK